MKLIEADGKRLLAAHGIAVPRGVLVDETDALPDFDFAGAAVKAQVLTGGRGKAGLVKIVGDQNAIADAVEQVRGALAASALPAVVLVEEKLAIKLEYYLSFIVDDRSQGPLMLFSVHGGMEVEGANAPLRHKINALRGLLPHDLVEFFEAAGVVKSQIGALARLATALYRVWVAEDLELLEINPLVVTASGKLIAADAKVVLDDCAASRHTDRSFAVSRRLALHAMTPLEREADRLKFTYIEMPGEVALMSYGAGLGMMLVDLLGDAGLRAACFVDGSVTSVGNNTAERLQVVFKRAEAPEVKAILFYQNLGTRDIKPRVDDVLRVLRETPPPKPFYFGFVATYLAEKNMTAAEACRLVAAEGYFASPEPRELVERIKLDCQAAQAAA